MELVLELEQVMQDLAEFLHLELPFPALRTVDLALPVGVELLSPVLLA